MAASGTQETVTSLPPAQVAPGQDHHNLLVLPTWIAIQLIGEDNKPIPGITYRVILPDREVREDRLDENGSARFENLRRGECLVTFPELDKDAWTLDHSEGEPDPDPPGGEGNPSPGSRSEIAPQPVGEGNYTVQQGECLSSIALEHGFFWDSLWNLEENRTLREKRVDPNTLLAGDRLFIPPLRPGEARCRTGQLHIFKRKGEPTKLRFRMLDGDDKPRANVPYRLVLDGVESTGSSNAEGVVDLFIPGNTRGGVLYFATDQPEPEEYDLELGKLDPAASLTGIQARLRNLGLEVGEIDGELDEELRDLLLAIQTTCGLPLTGQPDEATWAKIQEIYGS